MLSVQLYSCVIKTWEMLMDYTGYTIKLMFKWAEHIDIYMQTW